MASATEMPPSGITIGLESRFELPAKLVADFLAAHDRAYRKFRRELGLPPHSLVIANSGTSSWWAVLLDTYGMAGLASDHKDVLATFMTEFSAVVSKARVTSVTETKQAFVDLLKQYRKALNHTAVKAAFIGFSAQPQETFKSTYEVDTILSHLVPIGQTTAADRLRGTGLERPVSWNASQALDDNKLDPANAIGTALVIGGIPYVRLEGMAGVLLPALGSHAANLHHEWMYTFYGDKTRNSAGEPTGYNISMALPLRPLSSDVPLLPNTDT